MYITKIILKNIKCFRDLTYKFDSGERNSLVIAGDNGDGKSTILRSIGISLCDKWTAVGLLRELYGDFSRVGDYEDKSLVVLWLTSGDADYQIETEVKWNGNTTYEYLERKIKVKEKKGRWRLIKDEDFDWKDVFATGYGAGLRTLGTLDYQHYFTGDSIYSLFKPDSSLQNPELAILRFSDEKTRLDILKWLSELLMLEGKSLVVRENGLFIHNKKDNIVTALAASGDGYKAVTSLVLDMLSWWFLYKFYDQKTGDRNRSRISFKNLERMEGIVIIDELEQHLHPKWQKKMLPSLERKFPKVQFIVATHSPLVASSSKNKVLILGGGDVREESLYGWLAEDVYDEMGTGDLRPEKTREMIERYSVLYDRRLNGRVYAKDRKDFNSLEKSLKRLLPPHDPVLETIKLRKMDEYLKGIKS